jgi:hypothetical protein
MVNTVAKLLRAPFKSNHVLGRDIKMMSVWAIHLHPSLARILTVALTE